MGRGRARRPAGQRHQARGRILRRPWADLLLEAAEAARAEHRARRGAKDALLPALSLRAPCATPRRLLDGRTFANRARALVERLSDVVEREPLHARGQGAGRAAREARRGKRRGHEPRSGCAGGRAGAAGDTVRRRRRSRSADGEGAGDGVVADLRPEPGGERLRPDRADRSGLPPGSTSPEPRERRSVRAGVDLQGDHRCSRPRVAEVQARVVLRRSRVLHGLREAGEQLRHLLALRHRRPGDRAHVLRQLRVLQHRQGPRREAHPRHREALRVLRATAARDTDGRAPGERSLPGRPSLLPEARLGRGRGPNGVRTGAHARDALADGDGRRRDRRRRQAHGAPGGRQDRGAWRKDPASCSDPP